MIYRYRTMKTSFFQPPIIAVTAAFSMMAALSMTNTQANDLDRDSLAWEGKTYVFECNAGKEFVVDINHDGSWLFHEQKTLKLTEPGGLVAYTAPGMELLIDGENAVLREVEQITLFCKNNHKRAIWEHAKLSGVDFRAVGNEPGWSLEFVAGSNIIFISDYGSVRIERDLPGAITDSSARTTYWDADDLAVEVTGKTCQDSMDGEFYESSVIVYWNNQQFHGCGKALH